MLPPADAAPGTAGLTFVEAAWNATRQLSYVNTVVGDPLMVVRELIPGDADRDGLVGVGDLAWLAANLGSQGEPGTMWDQGDFNGDGVVNLADFVCLGDHWQATADWYVDPWIALATPRYIPEPSIPALAMFGLLALGGRLRGRRAAFA